MVAPIKLHCLLACKLSKCDHSAEKKSFISVAMSDSVSDVFSRIHDAYDKILFYKRYTFTATSGGDFIFLLGLGKGGAVNANTCYLWVIVPSPSFFHHCLRKSFFTGPGWTQCSIFTNHTHSCVQQPNSPFFGSICLFSSIHIKTLVNINNIVLNTITWLFKGNRYTWRIFLPFL